MWMTINERRFAVTLADDKTARAFAAQLPLTLHTEDLNGNEKHAKLPASLPANASRPGIIRNGDLMLYGDDTPGKLRACDLVRLRVADVKQGDALFTARHRAAAENRSAGAA